MNHFQRPSSLIANSKNMETQSVLKKVFWLLTGSVVMLIAILVLGGTLLISCESEKIKALDFNKKQQIARRNCLVKTPDCNEHHSPKLVTPNAYALVKSRLISGYPFNTLMPQTNEDALKDWVFLGHDLESNASIRVVSFDADKARDGTSTWPDEHFLGQP